MVSTMAVWRRQSRGVIALEAMFSMLLLFGAFIILWGIAVAIYNQSKLQSASQLAAQGALVVFDRETYRGRNVSGPFGSTGGSYTNALADARRVGANLYAENSCGMLSDAATGEAPIDCQPFGPPASQPGFRLNIQCAPEISGPWYDSAASAYQDPQCISGGTANARAVRAFAQGTAEQSVLLLAPLSGIGDVTTFEIAGTAESFSYYPEDGS